jgi:hypothetical protein
VLAFLLSTWWLLHPTAPSSVLYVVQRMTQMKAMFVMAGLLVYTRARISTVKSARTRTMMWAAYLLLLPLAAFSKETGLLL